jgi:cation:H+ antiporter
MLLSFIIFAVSLGVLVKAADTFIDTAVECANRLHISPMVVGLTIVAVGTSLPEAVASAAAAFEGVPQIAIGNVLGSNICNIALILGLPALMVPITCRREVIVREGSVMLGISVFLWISCLIFGGLSRSAGVVFVLAFFAFIYIVMKMSKKEVVAANSNVDSSAELAKEEKNLESSAAGALSDKASDSGSFSKEILIMVTALIFLLGSSKFLVDATVDIARGLGISETVIAISLIALGTSLPELAVSIAAVKKRQGDIMVGNILGSNISNILLVLGLTSAIQPFSVEKITLLFDFPMMILLSGLMFYYLYTEKGIDKPRGTLFLSLYAITIARCVIFP